MPHALAAERDAAIAAAHTAIELLEQVTERASVFAMHILAGETFGPDVLQPWVQLIACASTEAIRLRAALPDAIPPAWSASPSGPLVSGSASLTDVPARVARREGTG